MAGDPGQPGAAAGGGELALRAGEDARAAALRLGRAHDAFVSSHSHQSMLRPVVAGSWERCMTMGASPDGRRLPLFVQSGGCCAGITAMCFPEVEFIVGDVDLLLGKIEGVPFYIDYRL